MKAIQIKFFSIVAMLSIVTSTFCQTKIATIKISNIRATYIDRPGDLYVVQEDDSLTKFDIHGNVIMKHAEKASVYDPRDGSRSFLYLKSSQQFGFFTPEFGILHPIKEHYAIDPVLACASGDNQAWILDRSDWSLKRVDPNQSRVIADALIDQKQFAGAPEFIFMREYQNFLFLIEKNKGIIVFNSLGLQIKKIVESGITSVNFLGEELYYKKGDKLIFYDLFDASTREMPVDAGCKFVLLSDIRKYIIYEDRIEIFENQ